MGSLTRAIGNSFTTSGVIKSSAIDNTTLSNVSALPAAVPTGSMILLSTQTASGDASISFTTGIDSTYKEYMFIFNNIHPATDQVNFQFNGSTDGGSNYNVVKTSAAFTAYHEEADGSASLQFDTGRQLAQSTSYQNLNQNIGNDSDQSFSGTLTIFNPSSSTYVKHYISNCNGSHSSDLSVNWFISGYFNSTSSLNAVDFKFASGNIDAGTIQLFGIK